MLQSRARSVIVGPGLSLLNDSSALQVLQGVDTSGFRHDHWAQAGSRTGEVSTVGSAQISQHCQVLQELGGRPEEVATLLPTNPDLDIHGFLDAVFATGGSSSSSSASTLPSDMLHRP